MNENYDQERLEEEPVNGADQQEPEMVAATVDPIWESTPEMPPAQKSSRKPWVKTTLICVLAGAIAFGGGYAGVKTAYHGLGRVVIQQAASGSSSGGEVTAQTLSSKDVAAKVVPSVVAIRTEQMTTSNFWFGSQVTSGAGSGVILSEDGYILTNAHVISGADTITVELHDGTTYKATVVGSYASGDIAVVKIDATGLTPITFADPEAVKQGETVYAVGNPEGNFSGSITQGILSALARQINVSVESSNSNSSSGNGSFGGFPGNGGTSASKTITLEVLQFDAAVSPGNSGGGLFDGEGNLIGIVCAKSSDTDSEGLGFAIVGQKAQEIATALITDGSYTPAEGEGGSQSGAQTNTNKAVLGITATYLDETAAKQYGYSNAGVYVVSITEKSTLQAGLSAGDRIISIDGAMVSQLTDVTDYLADKEPGDKVSLSVERSGKMMAVDITLVENSSK